MLFFLFLTIILNTSACIKTTFTAIITDKEGNQTQVKELKAHYRLILEQDSLHQVIKAKWYEYPEIHIKIETKKGPGTIIKVINIPFNNIQEISFSWQEGYWVPAQVRILKNDGSSIQLVCIDSESFEEIDRQGVVKQKLECEDVDLATIDYAYLEHFTGEILSKTGEKNGIFRIELEHNIKKITFNSTLRSTDQNGQSKIVNSSQQVENNEKINQSCLDIKIPSLSPPDADLKFTDIKKFNKAFSIYSVDQVASYLLFSEILNDKDLNNIQKEYLQETTNTIKQHVLDVLARDSEIAEAKNDLRGAFFVLGAASEISDALESKAISAISTIKSNIFPTTKKINDPVFTITDPKGYVMGTSYTPTQSLKIGYSEHKITYSAHDGYCLVRITAQIKNVSNNSDPIYGLWHNRKIVRDWGLGFYKTFEVFNYKLNLPAYLDDNNDNKENKASRFMDYHQAYLITPDGEWHTPIHVCCELGSAMNCTSLTGQDDITFFGNYLQQGEEFKLDLIWTIRKDLYNVYLLLLGAPPVKLTITNNNKL